MFDKKLLIVDNDSKVAELVARVALEAGFETRTAHNDLSFVSIFEYFNPDVVVLDLVMPTMDGFEILKFLHSRQSHARIVILSGDNHYRERVGKLGDGLGLAIDMILPKPFRLHELRLALREIKFCLPENAAIGYTALS